MKFNLFQTTFCQLNISIKIIIAIGDAYRGMGA